MRDRTGADVAARVFLTLAALLPYWRLLTFGVIYVTDDIFTSDIFNGELPGRVLVGQLIRHGQMPVWTNQLCSGVPLAGASADPIGLGAFSLLPPAAALDLFVIVLLLVAAHGAYGLARRFGADRPGAVLTGIAFAGSGYIACQLKHLGIVSTVVWLPVGLLFIDRALDVSAPTTGPRRALFMALFGLVFAEQVLSAFPQSAYICALVYGSFALFRAISDRRRLGSLPVWLWLLGGLGAAAVLGAAAGAVVLFPLSALGGVSDRSEALGWVWSTRVAYWPPNVMNFLIPYFHGDISNATYTGPSIFWEDYGYVGIATVLLAIYGGVREWRRPAAAFSIVMTVVAFLLVLGAATPVFRVAYLLLPGMKTFRFPTRFLIVVELGLALLGGLGLTRLRADLERRWRAPSRVPRTIVLALCVGTAVDLFVVQPRQNPMVPARDWLAVPHTVEAIRADSPQPRTFTPRYRDLHMRTFAQAHGWADVEPYFELRDILAPNTGGGFWNTPSADSYAGIAARWFVDVWGDHNRATSLVSQLAYLDFGTRTLHVAPGLAKVLRTYGVSHVLSPYPLAGEALPLVSHDGNAYIYRVDGTARVRFVRAARHVTSDREAGRRLLDFSFDPDREILLDEAPDSVHPTVDEVVDGASGAAAGRAAVTREDSRRVAIEAEAPADGFLLLADTFYPGWTAQVDGVSTPIYRANHSVRGIQLPKGHHEVLFTFEAPGFVRGLQITLLAVSLLLLWAGVAAYVDTSPAARLARR
jgi:hypothetical protein